MTRGLTVSTLGHAALLAALMAGWAATPKLSQDVQPPIPVEVVDISDIARTRETPKPSIAAAPQKTATTDIATPPEPPPPPEPQALVPPEPTAELQPTPPQPVNKTDAAARKQLDQRLENLIDKSLREADRKRLNVSELARTLQKDVAKNTIQDIKATATLQQLMDAQVSACFNPPTGGSDVRKMTVQVRFRLNEAGHILDGPTIIGQTGVTVANSAFADALARATLRAILQCAPYKLPAEYKSIWANQDFELNFDPSRLL